MSIHVLSRIFGEHHRDAISVAAGRRGDVAAPAPSIDESFQTSCWRKDVPHSDDVEPQTPAERIAIATPFPQWLG